MITLNVTFDDHIQYSHSSANHNERMMREDQAKGITER